MGNAKKYSLQVSDELAAELEELKRVNYFNKSYSEMIRELLVKGIETEKKGKK